MWLSETHQSTAVTKITSLRHTHKIHMSKETNSKLNTDKAMYYTFILVSVYFMVPL